MVWLVSVPVEIMVWLISVSVEIICGCAAATCKSYLSLDYRGVTHCVLGTRCGCYTYTCSDLHEHLTCGFRFEGVTLATPNRDVLVRNLSFEVSRAVGGVTVGVVNSW